MMQHELLLFAAVFFLLGSLDDLAIDLAWLWLKLTGRAKTSSFVEPRSGSSRLRGQAAVFIPAWQEAEVIGDTVAHALAAWKHPELRLYIGCYRNDPATLSAVMTTAPDDPRVRVVILDRDGPSTKADCLNRLYEAMCDDERRNGERVRMVIFHDAEDMVDPSALSLLDDAVGEADFVQLPVLPVPQANSRWLGSHYCEEFAEAHGKALVVRDAIGAAIPSAGVGCAASREALDRLAERHGGRAPFAADSLTEDYELGLAIAAQGGRCRFVRARDEAGRLIATRAYFPSRLDHVVRQKTRWVHGISLQGWDRLGWTRSPVEIWMRLRDRRGPLTAFVLLSAYLFLAMAALGWGAAQFGIGVPLELSPWIKALLVANFLFFCWRASWRFAFTAREYGLREGMFAIARIPLANIIAIMAGRRAMTAYARTLGGQRIVWDKTPHYAHPARHIMREEPA